MIALLSEHIYSNPNTFVRELLQNCVDAITALHNIDESYAGRIDVFLKEDGSVVFQDNGIGLKEEEVHRFLTVIGESSKRYPRCRRFYRSVRHRLAVLFRGDQ